MWLTAHFVRCSNKIRDQYIVLSQMSMSKGTVFHLLLAVDLESRSILPIQADYQWWVNPVGSVGGLLSFSYLSWKASVNRQWIKIPRKNHFEKCSGRLAILEPETSRLTILRHSEVRSLNVSLLYSHALVCDNNGLSNYCSEIEPRALIREITVRQCP